MKDQPKNGDQRTPDLTEKTKARKDARRGRLADEMRKNLLKRKRQQREREDKERRS